VFTLYNDCVFLLNQCKNLPQTHVINSNDNRHEFSSHFRTNNGPPNEKQWLK